MRWVGVRVGSGGLGVDVLEVVMVVEEEGVYAVSRRGVWCGILPSTCTGDRGVGTHVYHQEPITERSV